jgi:hypothetical protein
VQGCNKTFPVRSNAKRHLRTHGIDPPTAKLARESYEVGWEPPVVAAAPAGLGPGGWAAPRRLRWVPVSLMGRTNVERLRALPEEDEGAAAAALPRAAGMGGPGPLSASAGREDDHDGECSEFSEDDGIPTVRVPLAPVVPSVGPVGEERNSWATVGMFPYHPQFVSV